MSMSERKWWVFGLCGAAAGLLNGLFGAGGGMVLAPLFLLCGKLEDKEAFSSSICVILPLCLVSLTVYSLRGVLTLTGALPYLIGGLMGGILGGLFYEKVPVKVLHRLFGLVILWGGIRLLW